MCKAIESIKLCSCSENLDLTKNDNETNYVWILERVIENNRSGMLGLTILPAKQLDALTPAFIVLELNKKNIFDFEYLPQDNDLLRIERIDRAKTREKEYLFGEFLKFHFYKGEWKIGGVSPFTYHLGRYKHGKLKLDFTKT